MAATAKTALARGPAGAGSAAQPGAGLALRFARRELRSGLAGFRIFIACLALGVAAIAAVQSLAGAVLSGLRDDGRVILGGDLAIRQLYTELTPAQRAYLDADPGVTEISQFTEMRTMARRPDGDERMLVEFKAVDNVYPLFGELRLADGRVYSAELLAESGGRFGALVEPAVAERLGLQVGDPLRVGELTVELRGVIAREPDRVGSGATFGFWPRLLISRAALPATALAREGSQLYQQYRLRLTAQADPGELRERLQQRFPDATWRLRDFRNAAPRVERLIGRLTLFLTLVGLTALLVGGVGVSNAVKAYLDGKLRTVAMLKCVGSPGRVIFLTYLFQLLLLAGVGIVIGLAIGALVPPLAALLLADLLPVPIRVGVYPGALLLAALFGLLTALTFTVWPLARAQQVPGAALFRAAISSDGARPPLAYTVLTVAAALALAALAVLTAINKVFALWFVAGAALVMLAFYLTARLVMWLTARLGRPRLPGLRLALANLHRPGASTANVVLSLGLGLTVLVAIALIEGNMSAQVRDSIPERAPAYFFVDVQSDQIEPFSKVLLDIDGADDLIRVPFLRGRLTGVRGNDPSAELRDPEHAWMIRGDRGLTYAETPPENGEIIQGDWWPADYAGPSLVSIHEDMAAAFDLRLGERIDLNVLGRDLSAEVASVRRQEWEGMQMNFLMVLSPEPLRRAPHGFLATVAADSPAAEAEIQRAVTREFPNVTTVRIKDALEKVNELLGNIGAAVRAIAAVTLLAGALVLAGTVAAGHRRRVYDSVVLKVLGATRFDVLRAFLLEYGLLGLITSLIAAGLGSLTAWAVLTQVMDSEFLFLPGVVALTLIGCVLLTVAFGFVGTWRALGQKAAPLLRNE